MDNASDNSADVVSHKARHLPYDAVLHFLSTSTYPDGYDKAEKRNLRRKAKSFSLHKSGCLMYSRNGVDKIVVLSQPEKDRVLKECHDDAGHKGIQNTFRMINQRYHWDAMFDTVQQCVESCDSCQRINPSLKDGSAVQLHPVPVMVGSFRQWGVDLVGPLVATPRKNTYIVAATCYFSKWPEAAAIQGKSAPEVSRFLYDLYCRYGAAEIVISDQGRELVNQVHEDLCKVFGVEHRVTSSYHPQANGLQERMNQTLQRSLQKLVDDQAEDWDLKLNAALFGARTTTQASTKHTPYRVVFGREATMPLELQKLGVQNDSSADMETYAKDFEEAALSCMETVAANISSAQLKQKQQFAKKHLVKKVCITVGTKVLVRNSRKSSRKSNKLSAGTNWLGNPYFIVDSVTPTGVCLLTTISGDAVKTAYPLSNLRPYKDRAQLKRQITSSGSFRCATCGKNVSTKAGLRSHMKVHVSSVQVYEPRSQASASKHPFLAVRCQCAICGYWFDHSALLVLHLMKHEFRGDFAKAAAADSSPETSEWVSELGLSFRHRSILTSQCAWLDDDIISAVMALLKKAAPHVEGLQNISLVEDRTAEIPQSQYVQIFNIGTNHWIVASNACCVEPEKEVLIYDSLQQMYTRGGVAQPSLPIAVLSKLATFHHCTEKKLGIGIMNVQQQPDAFNCGVFAAAFATSLCLGEDPVKRKYVLADMRSHLIACLESKQMKKFPSTREVRTPGISWSNIVDITCSCRDLRESNLPGMECIHCGEIVHFECGYGNRSEGGGKYVCENCL